MPVVAKSFVSISDNQKVKRNPPVIHLGCWLIDANLCLLPCHPIIFCSFLTRSPNFPKQRAHACGKILLTVLNGVEIYKGHGCFLTSCHPKYLSNVTNYRIGRDDWSLSRVSLGRMGDISESNVDVYKELTGTWCCNCHPSIHHLSIYPSSPTISSIFYPGCIWNWIRTHVTKDKDMVLIRVMTAILLVQTPAGKLYYEKCMCFSHLR